MTKTLYRNKILYLLLTVLLAIASIFCIGSSAAYADTLTHDYTNGGYLEVTHGKTSLIEMPKGTKGEDRSDWEVTPVNTNDKFGGWYRGLITSERTDFMNLHFNINGEKAVKTLSYIEGFDSSVILFGGQIESDFVTIDGNEYVEFYIPENLNFKIILNGVKSDVKTDTYTLVRLYTGATIYSIKDTTPTVLPENRTLLSDVELGVQNDVNRTLWAEKKYTSTSLTNNWFRFEKPAFVKSSTVDVANVRTTLNGKEYNAKLHYVIDDAGNCALKLGRFNVNYVERTILDKNYIEFYLAQEEIEYFETSEAVASSTLKLQNTDKLTTINNSLVKLEYDVEAVKTDIAIKIKPYSLWFGLAGGLVAVALFVGVIFVIRKRLRK